jgi:hypothetical protein
MNRATFLIDRHLCPDCGSEETQGRDRFGSPRPCVRCLVGRLVKAFHADMEDEVMLKSGRSLAVGLCGRHLA